MKANLKHLHPEDVKYLVVHCAATPEGKDFTAADIDRWHREQGWFGIGYHRVIRLNGMRESGRPLHTRGAHVAGKNDCSIGICLIGGVDADDRTRAEDTFTPEQKAALATELRELLVLFPHAEVVGHRDLDSRKACPSFDVRAWWKEQLSPPEMELPE